jgi:hypothetical protein
MAGYMRLAAKLLLGTTALSSIGGGGYYVATSGNRLWPIGEQPNTPSEGIPSVADSTTAGDLDAVASAWSQPLPSSPVTTDNSYSPTARSANATLANSQSAQSAPAPTAPDDRYGIYPGMQATVETAEIEVTSAELPADPATNVNPAAETTPSPGIEPQATTAPAATEIPSVDRPTPETSDGPTVARGQEPNEADDAAPLEAISISDNADTAPDPVATDDASELKPLSLPTGGRTLNKAAQRARDAFRDQSPSTDRYGASATPEGQRAANASPESVNPFATGATGSSSAASPLETLPPYSGDRPAVVTTADSAAERFANQGNGNPRTASSATGDQPRGSSLDASFGEASSSAEGNEQGG